MIFYRKESCKIRYISIANVTIFVLPRTCNLTIHSSLSFSMHVRWMQLRNEFWYNSNNSVPFTTLYLPEYKREHRSIRATVEMCMTFEAKSLCMLCQVKCKRVSWRWKFDDIIVVCFRYYQSQVYCTSVGLESWANGTTIADRLSMLPFLPWDLRGSLEVYDCYIKM